MLTLVYPLNKATALIGRIVELRLFRVCTVALLNKKKRKLIGLLRVYCFFLSISIPTIAIAIMIAIVAPMM